MLFMHNLNFYYLFPTFFPTIYLQFSTLVVKHKKKYKQMGNVQKYHTTTCTIKTY